MLLWKGVLHPNGPIGGVIVWRAWTENKALATAGYFIDYKCFKSVLIMLPVELGMLPSRPGGSKLRAQSPRVATIVFGWSAKSDMPKTACTFHQLHMPINSKFINTYVCGSNIHVEFFGDLSRD